MTKEKCLSILTQYAQVLHNDFGVKSLRLFGSMARDEQKEGSDVDLCVEMPPKMILLIKMKGYLEEKLGCAVDVVRIHKNMNIFLLNEIKRDGIQII